jgi:thymidine kinase
MLSRFQPLLTATNERTRITTLRGTDRACTIESHREMALVRGRFLRLFIGNMASGKTRHLLTEIDTLRKYGNKKIAVFKPRTDTRSGMNWIRTRQGDQDVAEEISAAQPRELWQVLRAKESDAGCRFEVLAFDEIQFFARDSGFFQLIRHLLDEGYDVLASGLAFDFRGEPFGSTADLALLAEDRCMWMTAYCTKCGARAPYPQRIIDGVPAHYNSPQILVGGDETYEPRCEEHFILPGRALPGVNDSSPQRTMWADAATE